MLVDETRFQLLKTSGFVLSFALVFLVQILAPYRRVPQRRSWRQNLPIAGLNAIVLGLVCGGCLCTAARFAEARHLGLLRGAAAPPWAASVVTVVALDFVLWGWHRANHRLSWLWRFHRVHHSDVDFDVSTGLRFHTGELVLSLPLKLVTVVLLGAPLLAVLLFELVFGLFNLFVHGDIRIAPAWETRLTRVLVLPASHRLHHALDAMPYGSNFGTVLSVWDRWLGTWTGGSSSIAIRTGLQDLLEAGRLSLVDCLLLPFTTGARGPARRTR
jgi:sterol desaturase/sphingolipid hydroxylase (fatty acid hydroxylase superfamily)